MVSAGVGAIIGAVIAAGAGAGQARMQQTEAKRGRARQQEQQAAAESSMVSQKREEAMETAAADREMADPTAILQAEEDAVGTMNRSRMSGAGGVDPEALRLGTAALLGE
jgi:hypothetical protein